MRRRTLLTALGSTPLLAAPHIARAQTPGVTATEIKIGHTVPYSGPASSYGAIGRGHVAFFKRVNDQGGIAGRKVNFITLDDGYSPPKTVEQVRRLVEQEGVAFMFDPLGTAQNSAIQKYMNQRKVPQLFIATGADKWADPEHFPWTMGWAPSYRTEAQVYGKYILKNAPNAKVALIYQNDDFGKDYQTGLKDVFGANYNKIVVKEITYEVTDATIDSQVVSMQASGADTVVTAATPKFGAQMIRKLFDIGWKPLHLLSNVSSSVAAVIRPAGAEKAVGIVTSGYAKDSTDPAWANDPGINEWRTFMKQYLPDADQADGNFPFSYGVCTTLMQTLKQCGNDLSRERIMHEAANLKDQPNPVLFPGILVNTSPTNYHPMRQMQLQKWNGTNWEMFGPIIQGSEI
jgi:branched-chain amino acid transport system substrate-binding protein